MGLAQALKRKLGGGHANDQHKRPCQPAGSQPPPLAAAAAADAGEAVRQQLANGGFAALLASHTGKNTRTAQRKQRKTAKQARQQAAQGQQQQQQQQRPGRHGAAAGSGSDNEGDGFAAIANGAAARGAAQAAAGDGEEGQQQGAPAAAYSRLLGSLRSGGGAFTEALQQRQREQAGDSDASSGDEDEAGSDEVGSDGEEAGSDSEGLSDSDLSGGEDEQDEDGQGGSEEEELGEEAEVGQRGGSEDEAGSSSSSEEDEGQQQQEQQNGRQQQQEQEQPRRHLSEGQAGAADAEAAAAAAAVEDHYLEHFESDLSEDQAAALLDDSRRTRYLECSSSSSSSRGGKSSKSSKKGQEQGPAVAADVARQWQHTALQAADGTCLPQSAPADLAAYGVKERLATRWREVASPAAATAGAAAATEGGSTGDGDFVSGQQRALFALLNCYSDLLLPCRQYPTDKETADPEMDAVLLHLLSHCAKAADRIKKNNDRLKAAKGSGVPPPDAVPKDQGFTRAKVLLLLPQRNLALRVVSRLVALAVKETRSDTIQNKQRFLEEFGDDTEVGDLSERERAAVARKPPNHRALFGGNTDDHFRMGVKITRGAVKLFADFYDCDIIVASPLALATRLAESAEEGACDFLSSIEILVAERADVLLMQNWAHVETVFEAVNQTPKEGHGVDMMRVRDWALSGRGALYRQTVLLSSFASAEMNALLARSCRNHAGKARLWPTHKGVLSQIIPQARQVFERLPAALAAGGAPAADADARFEHFKRSLWPRIRESGRSGGHLIYLPSYFDYVRVRNYLREEMASFLGLCEYMERADAARARAYFFDRRKSLLLYTERGQFYNRHRIRGAKDILFYQLPEHPEFYSELLNLVEEGEGGETPTVTVIFSKYDALRLERVVGSARSAKMLKERKTGTFLFC